MKILEIIIVICLILAAIDNFQLYDVTRWLVSILLLLSAANMIFLDSEWSKLIKKALWTVLIILLIRIFFFL